MIVATGRVARHVGAIADRVRQGPQARPAAARPGSRACRSADWVLIDTGDVIVHVFRPEVRTFYNLEKMWSAGRPSEIRPI